jgi:hypothetical protein
MRNIIVPIAWKERSYSVVADVIKALIQIVIVMVLEKSISFLMEAFEEVE